MELRSRAGDDLRLDRATVLAGARAILPLSIGVFPFGMAYGVIVTEGPMNDPLGIVASVIVLAGAAQLAMVDLLGQGAPWFVIVGTALIINARFVMYSGAMAPSFSEFPRRWRLFLAHFLTDQATVTSLLYDRGERRPRRRLAYLAGAAVSFALAWWAGTIVGVVIGTAIPPEFQVGFAAPLMFVALAVPSVRDRASLVAAAVGFSVTLIARDAPLNSGLLIGAATGIAFGLLAQAGSPPPDPLELVESMEPAGAVVPDQAHQGSRHG